MLESSIKVVTLPLANVFCHWRQKEFLLTLEPRRKWEHDTKNLEEGDLVLLLCKDLSRNSWPLARITKTFSSANGEAWHHEIILLRGEDDLKKMRTMVGWTSVLHILDMTLIFKQLVLHILDMKLISELWIIQYCAKVMQMSFAEIHGFSWLFDEKISNFRWKR